MIYGMIYGMEHGMDDLKASNQCAFYSGDLHAQEWTGQLG